MRIVIALGGNALLRRGEPLTFENQRQNIKIACEQIAKVFPNNELVIAHGNGPQVGLLALQGAAYKDVPTYPLDVLGAESVDMIGYMIQQELGNLVTKEGAQLACGDILVSGYTLLYSLDDLEGRLDPDIARHEDIL